MDVQLIPFVLFAGLLAIASFFDVAYRIIPNWVCGAVLLLGLVVIIGGVLGFAYLLRRMAPVIAPVLIRYTKAESSHLNYVPYGVAIAAGALACQVQPLVDMSF